MAYYPGYRTRPQDIGDYYSQGLFGGPTAPIDIDPYTDPHNRDDHHHDGPRRDSPTHHHPHRTHDPSKLPPCFPLRPTASPPSSSPPMAPRALSTPPPATSPSPSYFTFASIPSKILSEPTRKLLVLDLNGTLLLRAARPPKSCRGQDQQYPAPRRVMPRPYLTALRAYLFAPQTRAWLDVMVWSSAQPRNVEDMVLHAFGSDHDQLVAIWARDTLGLAEDHYYRKVQTIKDLEKPWEALAPEHSSPASPPSKPNSKLQPSSPTTWMGHSAATTILLDDSHAKAARQPYNHLYIPEYTRALRNVDIAALQHAQVDSRKDQDEEATALPDGSNNEALLKRKRKRKKEQPTQPVVDVPALAFDEMLLAVIGILHAARLQSSIAGWLRAGALLSERGAEWCEDPTLVHAWARRGRDAMQELQLEIEHGVVEP